MTRSEKAAKSRRGGSSMVEFALSFPLFVAAVAGLFQFGYAFLIYNNLNTAVRSGARYASLADYDAPNGNTFEALVRNVVVYGKSAPDGNSDRAAAPGLSLSNVIVDDSDKDGAGVPISITVSINNYKIFAVFDSFTLIGKPRSKFVYQGQFIGD